DVARPVEPGGNRQALAPQEGGIEQLRLVTRTVVAQHGDDGVPRSEVPCEPDRAGDVHARRGTDTETFFDQKVEDDGQRLAVGDLEGDVDRSAFQIAGDAALADPFGDRRSRR